jgi:esterase/lipase superfamily enzyme
MTNRPKRQSEVVHGFHNLFEDAATTAGKLAYDLKLRGAVIMFSWASGDATRSYPHDHENAESAAKHLKMLLLNLTEQKNIQQLDPSTPATELSTRER